MAFRCMRVDGWCRAESVGSGCVGGRCPGPHRALCRNSGEACRSRSSGNGACSHWFRDAPHRCWEGRVPGSCRVGGRRHACGLGALMQDVCDALYVLRNLELRLAVAAPQVLPCLLLQLVCLQWKQMGAGTAGI